MTKADPQVLRSLILEVVPADGAGIGNQSLHEGVQQAARHAKAGFSESAFEQAREALIVDGTLVKGKGRGGSVRRSQPAAEKSFALQAAAAPDAESSGNRDGKKKPPPKPASAPRAARNSDTEATVLSYRHQDKRKNNPEVGLVNEKNQPPEAKTTWRYDPYLDPALQFDVGRAQVERLIDDALASGDKNRMADALKERGSTRPVRALPDGDRGCSLPDRHDGQPDLRFPRGAGSRCGDPGRAVRHVPRDRPERAEAAACGRRGSSDRSARRRVSARRASYPRWRCGWRATGDPQASLAGHPVDTFVRAAASLPERSGSDRYRRRARCACSSS